MEKNFKGWIRSHSGPGICPKCGGEWPSLEELFAHYAYIHDPELFERMRKEIKEYKPITEKDKGILESGKEILKKAESLYKDQLEVDQKQIERRERRESFLRKDS